VVVALILTSNRIKDAPISVKTTETRGVRGYDAGKKIKGRKRHILVDRMGFLRMVIVHAADIQDRDGSKLVLDKKGIFRQALTFYATLTNCPLEGAQSRFKCIVS
jgi:hypothetical protein